MSNPTPDQVVSGIVPINDSGPAGGNAQCGISTSGTQFQLYARVEVHRLNAQGVSVEKVFSQTRTAGPAIADDPSTPDVDESAPAVAKGPWTASWDTTGLPNGQYRIQSFNRNATGTSGCTLAPEAITSDFVVTLENAVTVVADVPDSVVTGEDLIIPLTTQDEGTEVALPNRQVTVEVDGAPATTVVTDGDGHGVATVSLPDLPAGDRDVTFTVAGTPGYLVGRTVESSVELLPRTVRVTWTGEKESLTTKPAHLEARVTDATPGSDRNGDPISGLPVTLSFGNIDLPVTTDADGRAAATVNPGAPERQVPAGAAFEGDDVYSGDSISFTYLVKNGPAAAPDQTNGILGGVTRLLRGVLGQPSQSTPTVGGVLDNLVPGQDIGTGLNNILGTVGLAPIDVLQPVDSVLEGTLGGVLDTVGEVGDLADPILEDVLDLVGNVPDIGDVTNTLRYDFYSTYQRPDGTSLTRSVRALIGVPTPIDVTGDTIPDITANLTLQGATSPVLDVIKLPGAPSVLPMSVQAILGGGGLIDLDGGRIRLGFDSRTTSAPDHAKVVLGLANGFDLDLTTSGAQDLALIGTIEGGALDLGFGGPADPDSVDEGETRFSIDLSPAPAHTHIGLGIGGGAAGLGATFDTSAPTDITLSFAQDSGGGQLTAVNADFETVLGQLALVLDAGSSSGGPVPELGLQLLSDNGLDRVHVSAKTYDDGKTTDDLLLSLTDVPASVVFGVTDDGGLALTASAPIGLMRAGFASGGEMATLDEPAYMYLLSHDDYESVAIQLPGVNSMEASLSGDIGVELDMAPTKLRAVMDTPESSLDAAIYDSPGRFGLGLAADGAFLIQGSAPIDLITLTLHDSTGAIAGATDITVRIEDIPSLLAVSLIGDHISFDTGGQAVGLLQLRIGDAPPFVPGEDALFADFGAAPALAVRVHGLRTINAGLDPSAPEFLLDTVANAIMNLDISAPNPDPSLPPLDVSGRIDRLQPNMSFGVASTPDGNLAGLLYRADSPSNSISFDIPGLANFKVFDPLPKEFKLLQPPAPAPLTISGSEYFTLQLNASFDGIDANINTMRLRHMEFAAAEPSDPNGVSQSGDQLQAFYLNTTVFDETCPLGCVYNMGDPTRTFDQFNAGQTPGTLTTGTLVMGPIPTDLGNATVTMTPRGFAATQATVSMAVRQSGLSATALHVNTDGVLHCTGTSASNGTNLTTTVVVIILPITVQMRNALCNTSGSNPTPTPRADLTVESTSAPENVVAGTPVEHSVTVRNVGPNPASAVAITAAYTDALGAPTAACGAGGAASTGPGTVTCTYSGDTNRDATRTMQLSFPTDPSTPPGTAVTVDYTATSPTPGNSASVSKTTTVQADVANLEITGTTAPAEAVGGEGDLVQTATVTNTGPGTAVNARLTASPSGPLGAPTVTCSDGGTATGLVCTWPSVDAGESRTQTLTFSVPADVDTGALVVGYAAGSDTPGTGDTATATTEIRTVVANLALAGSDIPDRVLPGEELVQTMTIRNEGPSAGQTVRILADYDDVLGTPAITCSAGGTATDFPELQRARCLWLGATELGGERTITLTWTVDEDTALNTDTSVEYRATSDTPGDDVTLSAGTKVAEEPILPDPPTVSLSSVTGPALWAPGSNLVQTAVATTGGGQATAGLKIVADLPADSPVVPNPSGSCSNSGSFSIVNGEEADDTQAVCTWNTNQAAGVNRTMTLTWSSASLTTARTNAAPDDAVISVDYSATSDATGPTDSQNVTTTVKASVGNVNISSTGGTGTSAANNATMVHQAQASRANPTTGNASVVITATADPALNDLPAPTISCPNAVPTTGTVVETGVYQCTWAPSTATTGRVMTLTWPVGTTPGTYTTVFEASSDTPGAWGTVSRSTQLIDANTANINITGGSAPASILSNASMAHSATAARVAPVGNSATLVIRATADPDLAGVTPAISCSGAQQSGGVLVEPNVWECTWAASTATTARTMTLTYPAGSVPAGTQETLFTTSSSLPGTWAQITRTTEVGQATNTLSVVGITAPETAQPGDTVVHHLDVRNTGNVNANDVKVTAVHNGALGTPVVTCNGGIAATNPGTDTFECKWTGATGSNSPIRRITVTWNVDPSQADAVASVQYTATAAPAAGVLVTDATAVSATSVIAPAPLAGFAAPFWVEEPPASSGTTEAPPAPVAPPAPTSTKSCLKLVLGLKVCL